QAIESCDASLRADSKKSEVHRLKVVALLELKRYDDAVVACEQSLKAGVDSPDLRGLCGLAKSKRNDFAGAIADYTLALAARPSDSLMPRRGGGSYLMSEAFELARVDFDDAIRHDPANAEAYGGRASALVAIGHYRAAVLDAEESLHHGDIEPHLV